VVQLREMFHSSGSKLKSMFEIGNNITVLESLIFPVCLLMNIWARKNDRSPYLSTSSCTWDFTYYAQNGMFKLSSGW
jgi:hypothetical protein